MTKVDHIRNKLISRILTIKNEDFLIALDTLISSSNEDSESNEFTKEQELMLAMSEEDIANGRTISQEDLKKKSVQWLESKKG